MAKGVLIALGIMVVALLIPLVHFVAAPASPFIGEHIGISSAASQGGSPALKSLIFGILLGSLILIILAVAGAALTIVADLGRFQWVMWGGIAVISLYTASMSALGAMYSQLRAAQQSGEIQEAKNPSQEC